MIEDKVLAELEKYIHNPGDSEFLARFFKTGEGQYGAGDTFIGVRVPQTRLVAKKLHDISLDEMLLSDRHDLMHKAVGWVLRSAGDKDPQRLRNFLNSHITNIPRTALRYAIEHFDTEERQYFLALK